MSYLLILLKMTLITRQVTRAKIFLKVYNMGLVIFLTGILLTSCNTYIRPEEKSGLTSSEPNDTAMLVEALEVGKNVLQAAQIAQKKSSDQSVRIYAEKVSSFLQNSENKWDSLSGIKNLVFQPKPQKNKELAELELLDIEEFDYEFFDFIEIQLNRQMEMLENVSKLSEDNEISTLAIKMIPELQNQLDTLIAVRDANFQNF